MGNLGFSFPGKLRNSIINANVSDYNKNVEMSNNTFSYASSTYKSNEETTIHDYAAEYSGAVSDHIIGSSRKEDEDF